MYATLLIIHSWLRWVALVAGFGATLAALTGRVQSDKSPADRWGLVLMIALDIQLLLGLLLYFVVSANMKAILADFGGAMKEAAARFWAVEHVTAMLLAVILAHLGRVLARKAKTPASKRTRLLVCFGLAMLLMLAGIPWPGRPGGRELFRFGFRACEEITLTAETAETAEKKPGELSASSACSAVKRGFSQAFQTADFSIASCGPSQPSAAS